MTARIAANPFQSTHPMRGATLVFGRAAGRNGISIHAPHAGCDPEFELHGVVKFISIHAPHAGCDQAALPVSL